MLLAEWMKVWVVWEGTPRVFYLIFGSEKEKKKGTRKLLVRSCETIPVNIGPQKGPRHSSMPPNVFTINKPSQNLIDHLTVVKS